MNWARSWCIENFIVDRHKISCIMSSKEEI